MNASVDSVFPEKYRILSGSALKMIAVITMLIDHIGAVLLSMYQPAQKILFTLFGREYTVYLIFRDIGRAAFPIFCFLLLEGFRHTRSRFLYGRNLLLFALLSEKWKQQAVPGCRETASKVWSGNIRWHKRPDIRGKA